MKTSGYRTILLNRLDIHFAKHLLKDQNSQYILTDPYVFERAVESSLSQVDFLDISDSYSLWSLQNKIAETEALSDDGHFALQIGELTGDPPEILTHWFWQESFFYRSQLVLAKIIKSKICDIEARLMTYDIPTNLYLDSGVPSFIAANNTQTPRIKITGWENTSLAPQLPDLASILMLLERYKISRIAYIPGISAGSEKIRTVENGLLILPSPLDWHRASIIPMIDPTMAIQRMELVLTQSIVSKDGKELCSQFLGKRLWNHCEMHPGFQKVFFNNLLYFKYLAFLLFKQIFNRYRFNEIVISDIEAGINGVIASACEACKITPLVVKHSSLLGQTFCLNDFNEIRLSHSPSTGYESQPAEGVELGPDSSKFDGKRSTRLSIRRGSRSAALNAKVKEIVEKIQGVNQSKINIGIILNETWGHNISVINTRELLHFVETLLNLQYRYGFEFSLREKPGHLVPSFLERNTNIPILLISKEPSLASYLRDKNLVIGWGIPSSALLDAKSSNLPVVLAGYVRNYYHVHDYNASLLNTLNEDYFSAKELFTLLERILSGNLW